MHHPDSHAFEQRFWLPVLKDHCQFILDALSPGEQEEIQKASALLQTFLQLAKRAETADLEVCQKAAEELREFKLHLLCRLLTDQFSFHLPPTFINHMVNELEEYMRILSSLRRGQTPPPLHPLHHHLLWLPDAAGHAEGLQINTDGVEKKIKEKQHHFIKTFESFYIKAVELTGYLRTRLHHFPSLARFNKEVELEIILFQSFLKELVEMGLTKEVLGTIAPLMADHMYREECYYLHKLAQVSAARQPKCSPFPKE
ncbi:MULTISPECIES: DUF2935 domain-containing protein [Thermoactinomyces]|jgi:hypothetical protein|uniref:DUF2935 domain-containing protein n=1 Tax=Thermoactinomyces daqus TaxID=1329516 RepID=A0A7W2AHL8_9BACL|nr:MULTISPECIES: DUF2935 domain-containing protein [Thermoactinomyces]MBA4543342.1 DUF2935 domain-containing protein [Thermoactinomyces daqus]MBH8598482.1 DUF2935 domain-containing protein [Thermoactinomyces sp. CICC 10523]MBH8604673.1 DUF2935 domain-containing protein [Thermoactinomyces sp. CICC 10522]MBH8606866.1 DUF2935 domain-containing protein [Thermoactinomyces sp. CICC 10521]